MSESLSSDLQSGALVYHSHPRPGKLEIRATKPLGNQRDLALAYSPGVAAPCLEIAAEPDKAGLYTARQNLVAVVTNGTAVLGLGDIGPLAAKPVMEGKAVLFKKFAGIDVFDIELNEKNVDRLVDAIAALEPTFGGINLEDIKAPECFEVERRLREKLAIPVFHDDQHGTAIIVGAAVTNGLKLARKRIEEAKIVASGAGAAALACLGLLVSLGARRENIWVTDLDGVVFKGRNTLMDPLKETFAQDTQARTLAEVIPNADVFLGLSAGGVLKPDMVRQMAATPLILALANPHPEILPEEALAVRPDAVLCTGRSDYPNQVNNVLCFPYIFRGALDVGATTINEAMKLAAVEAIAALAQEPPADEVARAAGIAPAFGKTSLIPSPFDPRLMLRIAPAVAEAAAASGVARHPIDDFDAYRARLEGTVFRSGFIMKPLMQTAKANPRRVVYSEGEDERVLRAVQSVVEEEIARPILIGRRAVIEKNLKKFGLAVALDRDFDLIDPENDPRYKDYVASLVSISGRRGVNPGLARTLVRTNNTVIGALALARGEADGLLCGLEGRYTERLGFLRDVIGVAPGVSDFAAMSLMITSKGAFFIADTHVRRDPSAAEIAETAILCAAHARRFGLTPKIAFVSDSDFGSDDSPSAAKMREAVDILRELAPELEADGEMKADSALSEVKRLRVFPDSRLKGVANILIMPNLPAANIAYQMTKMMADALPVGPILLGAARPAHIITPSVTARGIVNMTAVVVAEAQHHAAEPCRD
ncbi:malate dehydrogenase (oxaloacetate-decarboxylating)(NADP+) [Rhodoblastus acidophilus]|uniref:NADP-dependent malic enzyme n=1 Tax=Rhodoblastus acidophilus TaxID=1074 RepID=UPI0022240B7B|nr:NADP-dependent malic enzyme [Rhodoblastus acidophilus]MCW2283006.1 malate dehydrogenase (oxaloacetate-decarboxylating)(NADP+) [Rhodoblastus acidophilus]MCW2331943.1 malate dehydrogenase (oxaloacetate-decarboxylating)(NADP+) [Rhodoblastus acidophilus]